MLLGIMPLLISSSPGLECRQKKNCHVRIHCLFRHVLFFGKTWSPAALKKHIQGVHRLFMEIVWVLLWCCCHTLWQIWKRLIFELLIVVYKKRYRYHSIISTKCLICDAVSPPQRTTIFWIQCIQEARAGRRVPKKITVVFMGSRRRKN